jgi:hypothetical protein
MLCQAFPVCVHYLREGECILKRINASRNRATRVRQHCVVAQIIPQHHVFDQHLERTRDIQSVCASELEVGPLGFLWYSGGIAATYCASH